MLFNFSHTFLVCLFFFSPFCMVCGILDPWLRTELKPPALETQSSPLDHQERPKHLSFRSQFEASLVAWMVKNLPAMQENHIWSLGGEDPLEKEMAAHSSILAWRIPWTEEPGKLHTVHGFTKSQTWLVWLSTHVDLKQIEFLQQRWVYFGSAENCNSESATMASKGRRMLL